MGVWAVAFNIILVKLCTQPRASWYYLNIFKSLLCMVILPIMAYKIGLPNKLWMTKAKSLTKGLLVLALCLVVIYFLLGLTSAVFEFAMPSLNLFPSCSNWSFGSLGAKKNKPAFHSIKACCRLHLDFSFNLQCWFNQIPQCFNSVDTGHQNPQDPCFCCDLLWLYSWHTLLEKVVFD